MPTLAENLWWQGRWSWIGEHGAQSWQPSLSMKRATPVYKTCHRAPLFSLALWRLGSKIHLADRPAEVISIGLLCPSPPACSKSRLLHHLWSIKGRHPNEVLPEFR